MFTGCSVLIRWPETDKIKQPTVTNLLNHDRVHVPKAQGRFGQQRKNDRWLYKKLLLRKLQEPLSLYSGGTYGYVIFGLLLIGLAAAPRLVERLAPDVTEGDACVRDDECQPRGFMKDGDPSTDSASAV